MRAHCREPRLIQSEAVSRLLGVACFRWVRQDWVVGRPSHLSEALHPDAGRWRTADRSDCGWAIGIIWAMTAPPMNRSRQGRTGAVVAGRATTAHQVSCLIGSEAGQGL